MNHTRSTYHKLFINEQKEVYAIIFKSFLSVNIRYKTLFSNHFMSRPWLFMAMAGARWVLHPPQCHFGPLTEALRNATKRNAELWNVGPLEINSGSLCVSFTEQENQSHVLIAFGPSHMAWNRTLKAFKQESKYQNWYDLAWTREVIYRQQLFLTMQLGVKIHLQGWHIGLKIQG